MRILAIAIAGILVGALAATALFHLSAVPCRSALADYAGTQELSCSGDVLTVARQAWTVTSAGGFDVTLTPAASTKLELTVTKPGGPTFTRSAVTDGAAVQLSELLPAGSYIVQVDNFGETPREVACTLNVRPNPALTARGTQVASGPTDP